MVDKRTLRDVEFYNSLTDHRRQGIARHQVKHILFAREQIDTPACRGPRRPGVLCCVCIEGEGQRWRRGGVWRRFEGGRALWPRLGFQKRIQSTQACFALGFTAGNTARQLDYEGPRYAVASTSKPCLATDLLHPRPTFARKPNCP